jgi:malonyl-CoA O-methyltransferase
MNAEALYSRIADSYDVTLTLAGYRMAVDYFIKQIPLDRMAPIRILDAGCGTGFYSLALLKRYPKCSIVAFDLNQNMIEQLQKKVVKKGMQKRIEVFRADMVTPLSLEEGQFDLLVTAGVLEYVRIEDAVSNLSRYLSKDGYWLNSPIKTNLFGQIVGKMYRLRPYTRDKNIDVFRTRGFALMNIHDFLSLKEAHIFRKIV